MKRRERVDERTTALPEELETFDEADWLDVVPPEDIPAAPWRRMAWRRARRAHDSQAATRGGTR